MDDSSIFRALYLDKERLIAILENIPKSPGCYIFKDNAERILYIGKSKVLRQRVRTYFGDKSELSPRILLMIKQVFHIEYIITDNDSEALTLESNLIKSHQPYFNILLKDDKKYPYVCVTWGEQYPRIFITRKRRERSKMDKYYGPYVDVTLLRKTIFLIKTLFPLRQRPIPLYKDRTCLNFSIGRCPGVCQKLVTPESYKKTIKNVSMIFQGRSEELVKSLTKKMNEYSSLEEYEKAAKVRDQIKGLNQLSESQKMTIPDSSVNRDVIAFSSNKRICCVQLFQMRSGKLVGRIGYNYDISNLTIEVIIQKTLEHHYGSIEPVEIPGEIVTELKLPKLILLQEWLTEIKGHRVKLINPKRKDKAKLVELVKKNAHSELQVIEKGTERNNIELEDLSQILELTVRPHRIEGYDISHIQGTNVVGSQVVFIDGIPAKQHYRTFNITSESVFSGHSDDYMSLAEVIRRRFRRWSELKKNGVDIQQITNKRLSKLDPITITDWPNLIMIDGGKGQLNAVLESLRELGLEEDVNICSLAKSNEELFIPGIKTPINTDKEQPGMHLLRRLRNEAHRFAIFSHRNKRSKHMRRSQLSEIPGVGPKKIKELLAHFKSVQAIQIASKEQIQQLPGFGKGISETIWKYFNPD